MRPWLLPIVLVSCSFDRNGLGESIDLTDSTIAVDDTFVAPTDSAIDTFVAPIDTAPEIVDTAPPDPLYIECESGALFGGMTIENDSTASGTKWASVPTTATPWAAGTGAPPTRVELPATLPAGTWYVWVSMYTRNGDADAMYVGFAGGPLRRFFTTDWNKFKWVGAEGSGVRLDFSLMAGPATLYVGAGESGTGCDRVALTRDSTWTPP